jgi:heavy metal sensor kinase
MKRLKFKSIRVRLTLWYALVLGFIFLVSDIILYQSFKMSLTDTIDNTLQAAAEEVEDSIFKAPPEKWNTTIKQVERGFMVNRMFIQLVEVTTTSTEIEESFHILARSGVLSGNISQREIWESLSHQFPETPVYMNVIEESTTTHPLRIILYPVQKSENKSYLIQVGTSLKKMFHTLRNFLIILIVSGPLLLLVSVFGGHLILKKALVPVKSVVQTARKISTEDLSLRIESRNRKDEIGELITTFNQMISRLEGSVAQIKQFSSDASHDLKTPLTVIRGEIDIALRKERVSKDYIKTLSTVQKEAQKLERIIDNLLFLSRIDDREYRLSFQKIQLDEILLNMFENAQQLATEKSIHCVIKKMDSVFIQGDPILLNRLIMNLLDNAIKYTPARGQVEFSLEMEENHKTVCLTVQDTGIGIPRESLPFIFDRFYRVDQSRSQRSKGSGLGLSIVKKIAEIHQAHINVHSELNQGTKVQVFFPTYV